MNANYKKVIEIGSFAIALIGVPFYFFDKYLEATAERRVRTLDYVNEFQSGRVLDQRLSLLGVLESLDLSAIHNESPSKPVVDKLVYDLMLTNDDFRIGVINVSYHFDTIHDCVDAGECVEGIVMDTIGKDAESFHALYGNSLARISQAYGFGHLGEGLRAIAEQHAALNPTAP